MPDPQAFYELDGDVFLATELTRGPWDAGSQHAGPPAALIARAFEALPAEKPMQVGRITYEILRPVPIGPVRVSATVVRPGRSVEMCEAELAGEDGIALIRARGWRLRAALTDVPVELGGAGDEARAGLPPDPQRGEPREFFATGQSVGYHTGMEYRFASGAFREPGPATAWLRMRHPLVTGEDPSPLVRVMMVADTGNGISAVLDLSRFLFINVDLNVHLHRLPAGEWVGLDAVTYPELTGIGFADSLLFDEQGRLGRAGQTLFVAERD